MTIRAASEADRDTLLALWDEWVGDAPLPPWVRDARADTAREIDLALREGAAALADMDGDTVGFSCGVLRGPGTAEVTELYVRESSRRRGLGRQLLRSVVSRLRERGAEFVRVEVGVDNAAARAFYGRAGFQPELLRLVGEASTLEERLGERAGGPTFGSIHAQTDDTPAVERAVREFVPRLPGRSRGSVVAPPRNGWISVYDDVCDRDPTQLRRLALELSVRMGVVVIAFGVEQGAVARFILFEHGTVVDEYLSVQEYYGALPPGEVVALQANPRVVARLTGADPAAVRAAAVHGVSPGDLPPAAEIVARLAQVMGIEGADHGWMESEAQ